MSTPRRVAIVDDEPIARLGLRRLLEKLPQVVLVGEARSGPEAARLFAEHVVDIAFLDVHMPGADGFEVLARLPADRMPVIVMVTAFDEYAVQAFDLDVADYLLKPFDVPRFTRAWERACIAHDRRQVDDAARPAAAGAPGDARAPHRLRPFLLRRDGRVHVVAPREVEWIEAAHNRVRVHTTRGPFEWRQSLQALTVRLARHGFVRVHRSALVNAGAIARVHVARSGDGDLELHRGGRVPLSRRYREALDRVLRP